MAGDRMKKKILLFTIFFIVIDQISKWIVSNQLALYDSVIILKNFFSFTYVQNTGAAFGILEGNIALFIGITIFFLVYFMKVILEDNQIYLFKELYYSMVMSGIIGNLIDRLVRGYVIDFFSFTIFSYSFPVFNVADILIVGGIFFFFIDVVRGDICAFNRRRRSKNR